MIILDKNTRFDLLEHEALTFSFDVEGKIWKMAFDNDQSNLVLELRVEETFDVSYLVFNLKTFEITEYLHFEQIDWWSSLVDVSGSYLFIDKYNDPQNPVEKSLLIFDWSISKMSHTLDDFQLGGILNNAIIGNTVKLKGDEISVAVPGLKEKSVNGINYPSFYEPDQKYFKLVCELLDNVDIKIGVEYLENDHSLALSYYLVKGEKYVRYLLVIKNDVEIYHEVIDELINGKALGSFFVIGQKLLFIKDQTQLNAIEF